MNSKTLDTQITALVRALEITPRMLLHCAQPKQLIQRFTFNHAMLPNQIPHHTTRESGLVGEWRLVYTQTPTLQIPEPERIYKWSPGCMQSSDCLVLYELDMFSSLAIDALVDKLRKPDVRPNQRTTQYPLIDPSDRREWNHRPAYILATPSDFQTESSRKRIADFSRRLELVDFTLE